MAMRSRRVRCGVWARDIAVTRLEPAPRRPIFRSMTRWAPRKLNHALKTLPAMLAALVLASAAAPAFAEGDGVPGRQNRAPDLTVDAPVSGSDLALAHKLRLGLPSALTGEQSADAPKFSIELGYGKSAPPTAGAAGPAKLPQEYWGRADERAVKANLSLGF
jgi:hypothetical protein